MAAPKNAQNEDGSAGDDGLGIPNNQETTGSVPPDDDKTLGRLHT